MAVRQGKTGAHSQSPEAAVPSETSSPERSGQRSARQSARHREEPPINIGERERVFSFISGSVLTLTGILRGSIEGLAMAVLGGGLAYRGATGYSALYRRMGITTSRGGYRPPTTISAKRGVRIEKTVTINRRPEDLFQFWRNFEHLPRIMKHVEAVKVVDDKRSHWVVTGPGNMRFEWDAIINQEQPDELIAWRSIEGSEVDSTGSVHFKPAPGGRGTELKVVLRYDPPGGRAAVTVARLLGQDPEREIEEDLRHFKQIMEAGEVATTIAFDSARMAHA